MMHTFRFSLFESLEQTERFLLQSAWLLSSCTESPHPQPHLMLRSVGDTFTSNMQVHGSRRAGRAREEGRRGGCGRNVPESRARKRGRRTLSASRSFGWFTRCCGTNTGQFSAQQIVSDRGMWRGGGGTVHLRPKIVFAREALLPPVAIGMCRELAPRHVFVKGVLCFEDRVAAGGAGGNGSSHKCLQRQPVSSASLQLQIIDAERANCPY
jgi:hypothetical protein